MVLLSYPDFFIFTWQLQRLYCPLEIRIPSAAGDFPLQCPFPAPCRPGTAPGWYPHQQLGAAADADAGLSVLNKIDEILPLDFRAGWL